VQQADRPVRMAVVAAGGSGEQMIVVLDGTRVAPGACAGLTRLAPDVVQRWPCWSGGSRGSRVIGPYMAYQCSPTTPRVTVS